eukprot:1143441-Pelagomonas_calceolata.AAC.2
MMSWDQFANIFMKGGRIVSKPGEEELFMLAMCLETREPMKEGCPKSPGALPVLRVGCKQIIVCIRNFIEAPYVGMEARPAPRGPLLMP